ncbi:MAG: hypothetical protein M1816_008200 [Peltula sp. TS41687]|nr:MAG: hypothetical protein M1816_008200 [Peltula sp. TS41687]
MSFEIHSLGTQQIFHLVGNSFGAGVNVGNVTLADVYRAICSQAARSAVADTLSPPDDSVMSMEHNPEIDTLNLPEAEKLVRRAVAEGKRMTVANTLKILEPPASIDYLPFPSSAEVNVARDYFIEGRQMDRLRRKWRFRHRSTWNPWAQPGSADVHRPIPHPSACSSRSGSNRASTAGESTIFTAPPRSSVFSSSGRPSASSASTSSATRPSGASAASGASSAPNSASSTSTADPAASSTSSTEPSAFLAPSAPSGGAAASSAQHSASSTSTADPVASSTSSTEPSALSAPSGGAAASSGPPPGCSASSASPADPTEANDASAAGGTSPRVEKRRPPTDESTAPEAKQARTQPEDKDEYEDKDDGQGKPDDHSSKNRPRRPPTTALPRARVDPRRKAKCCMDRVRGLQAHP